MPDIPDGTGLARFGFTLTGDSEKMYVTLGYRTLIGQDFAAHDGACTGLEQDFWDNVVGPASDLYSHWTYHGLEASAGIAGGQVTIVKPRVVAGTAAGGQTPPQNCAMLVKKKTALAGRRNQGRLYMPPSHLGEGQVNSAGVLDTAVVTSWQGRWNAFFADSQAGGNYELVLLHSLPGLGDVIPLTSFVVDPVLATQRRRLRK